MGPLAQVIHAIDDPAPELAIGGSGSERAMLFECSRRKPEKLSRIRRSKIFRSGNRVEIRIRVHLSPAFRMGQGGQRWLSARRRADWRSAAAQRESRSSGGVIISPWTSETGRAHVCTPVTNA